MKNNEIFENIPNTQYDGYYWLSDASNPLKLNNQNFLDHLRQNLSDHNFIIEAMLWDSKNKKSIMITHTGRYNIHLHDIDTLSKDGIWVCKEYIPHRLKGVNKVKFKQYWKEEADPFCCGFNVLVLKALIFVGFEKEPTPIF